MGAMYQPGVSPKCATPGDGKTKIDHAASALNGRNVSARGKPEGRNPGARGGSGVFDAGK